MTKTLWFLAGVTATMAVAAANVGNWLLVTMMATAAVFSVAMARAVERAWQD